MRPAPRIQAARSALRGPSPFLFALILNFAAWGVLIAMIICTLNGEPL